MNKDLRGAITSGKLTLINVGSIIVLRPIVICRDVDVDPDPVGSGLIWLSGSGSGIFQFRFKVYSKERSYKS